jgi:two-component system LytT family response regulator
MQKIKAILVDDEESARDVLENLLKRFCPEVELIAKCSHMEGAVEAIKQHQPQLVFLDIEMPRYAGFEIVRFFDEIDFEIVFVTAYDRYAIRAFEISAVDYLLKPIDIERLQNAVKKVSKKLNAEQQAQRLSLLSNTLENKHFRNIVISDKSQQYIIAVDDVIAIEAMESYCTIHTVGRKHTVSKNLKHYEVMLDVLPQFIRTHKSWIVNKNHLIHYSKSTFTITLTQNIGAKLSKYKKSEFEDLLLT